MLMLRLLALALAVLLPAGAIRAADPAADEQARRAIHLLDYLAVDYPATVSDGVVANELEYAEQLEFVGQVRAQLGALGVGPGDPLATALASLESAIRARAPGAGVTAQARTLAVAVRERFAVQALPAAPPSLARGQALFAEHCSGCHGAAGRGDGPAGRGLEPAPSNLTDPARMHGLSPFALYSTISYGIAGTAMTPYAAQLDDAQRWDLAFYAGSLAFAPEAAARGRALGAQGGAAQAARLPDLDALVHRSATELAPAGDADAEALVAWLRTRPEDLRGGELPLDVARSRLDASLAAYAAGDRTRALDLAVSAYLDGFEHAEPALDAVDPALRTEIETGFLRYRAALRAGRATAEVEPLAGALAAQLERAREALAAGRLGAPGVFVASLTILAREGLEAVLLVVALVGILRRAGRPDALGWVHGGWIAALVAGALTWWLATRVVAVSGASREVVEGLSALTAAAILFYVSYWMISKIEVARWQAFLDGRIKTALSRGSLWTLAGVAFVAVYRECFETVLFYQALAAQAGPSGGGAIAAGVGAGVVLLAALAAAVFRFGQRLPLQRFFAWSSLLLYVLSVVLAGQGVAALQEADWVPVTAVPFVRIEWLGIYPTAQGLAVQGALALAALAGLPKLLGGLRRTAPAG